MKTEKKKILKGEIATAVAFYLETAAMFGLEVPCKDEMKNLADKWKPGPVLQPKTP